MRNLFLATIALGGTLLASPVLATPLNGKSISNVIVGGTSYTVNFFDSALAAVPPPQVTFTTFTNANSGIAAVVSSAAYTALIATANTPGVASSYYKGLIVPYTLPFGPSPTQYNGAVGASASNANLPLYYNSSTDPNTNGDYTTVGYSIAQFAATVPEPASIAVLALGLFGLGWARRRVG